MNPYVPFSYSNPGAEKTLPKAKKSNILISPVGLSSTTSGALEASSHIRLQLYVSFKSRLK